MVNTVVLVLWRQCDLVFDTELFDRVRFVFALALLHHARDGIFRHVACTPVNISSKFLHRNRDKIFHLILLPDIIQRDRMGA